jgi:N-acetylglucosaminyldiphosphoundecaprenol N-acetyl-beta-D-mannosaminyltransferase
MVKFAQHGDMEVTGIFVSSDDRPRTIPYRLRRRDEERVTILGAEVDLVRPEEMLLYVSRRLRGGQSTIIANHNLNSLQLIRDNPEMQAFYDMADLVELDSIPMIFWARLMGHPARRFHRCTYLDWRDTFWRTALQEKWRVFYLGGQPGVAERGAEMVEKRHPGVQISGRHGYFDMDPGSSEAAAVLAEVQAFRPDVVLVGMGMPRQEVWITRNAPHLTGCAMFTVGAAFDYEAGVQQAAPRWLGLCGFEWLYRLACDPRRLARRYLVESLCIFPAMLTDLRSTLSARRQAPALRAGRTTDAQVTMIPTVDHTIP